MPRDDHEPYCAGEEDPDARWCKVAHCEEDDGVPDHTEAGESTGRLAAVLPGPERDRASVEGAEGGSGENVPVDGRGTHGGCEDGMGRDPAGDDQPTLRALPEATTSPGCPLVRDT